MASEYCFDCGYEHDDVHDDNDYQSPEFSHDDPCGYKICYFTVDFWGHDTNGDQLTWDMLDDFPNPKEILDEIFLISSDRAEDIYCHKNDPAPYIKFMDAIVRNDHIELFAKILSKTREIACRPLTRKYFSMQYYDFMETLLKNKTMIDDYCVEYTHKHSSILHYLIEHLFFYAPEPGEKLVIDSAGVERIDLIYALMKAVPDSELLLKCSCRPGWCHCSEYEIDWLYQVFGAFNAVYLLEMKKGIYIMDRIMNVYMKHDMYRIAYVLETATHYRCPESDLGTFMCYVDYAMRKITKIASDKVLQKLRTNIMPLHDISRDIVSLIAKEQIYRRRKFAIESAIE